MKTTVDLSDELVRSAKQVARERGTTMRDLIERGLRRELERVQAVDNHAELRFLTFGGDGLVPGVRMEDLRDLAYDEPAAS